MIWKLGDLREVEAMQRRKRLKLKIKRELRNCSKLMIILKIIYSEDKINQRKANYENRKNNQNS